MAWAGRTAWTFLGRPAPPSLPTPQTSMPVSLFPPVRPCFVLLLMMLMMPVTMPVTMDGSCCLLPVPIRDHHMCCCCRVGRHRPPEFARSAIDHHVVDPRSNQLPGHSPCSKHGLSSNTMALITSGRPQVQSTTRSTRRQGRAEPYRPGWPATRHM